MLMIITRIFNVGLCIALAIAASAFVKTNSSTSQIGEMEKEALLKQHNLYRNEVGVPNLEWDDELAAYAQKWADHLAKSCNMVHSSGSYGENIYWTSGSSTASHVVDRWASEKRYFNLKNPVYKSGAGSRYGHYTQMIWKKTTHVGGGMANCRHGGEIWVCSYNPHGNVIGERAF